VSPSRLRLLDARQLGLKLIANVTYGYTAANFSGRMPCVDIADSIVSKGKETLSRAKRMVEEQLTGYGASVIYGDTDSLFIRIPGVSKATAFALGRMVAANVSKTNPVPVKLKFEKVYLPCILETKKRYVGFMWETENQTEPEFEAKGIETIRRDGCGLTRKMLERSLKILFRTKDVSQVKAYVQQQFADMLSESDGVAGALNLTDFIFAKEYKGAAAYRAKHVPQLKIALERKKRDPRSEPVVKERVPYVLVKGDMHALNIERVLAPEDAIKAGYRLDLDYYFMKQVIPALNRAFEPMGVDTLSWYTSMPLINPRVYRVGTSKLDGERGGQNTLTQNWKTNVCPICHEGIQQIFGMGPSLLCESCRSDPAKLAAKHAFRLATFERRYQKLVKLCTSCIGAHAPNYGGGDGGVCGSDGLSRGSRGDPVGIPCEALGCQVFYERSAASRAIRYARGVGIELERTRTLEPNRFSHGFDQTAFRLPDW
jgi:DNA polymerase zeta